MFFDRCKYVECKYERVEWYFTKGAASLLQAMYRGCFVWRERRPLILEMVIGWFVGLFFSFLKAVKWGGGRGAYT